MTSKDKWGVATATFLILSSCFVLPLFNSHASITTLNAEIPVTTFQNTFLSHNERYLVFESPAGSNPDSVHLYVVDLTQPHIPPHRITDAPVAADYERRPTFFSANDRFFLTRCGTPQLCTYDFQTQQLHRHFEHFQSAAITNDGERLAFFTLYGDIYSTPTTGGDLTDLRPFPLNGWFEGGVRISPNGQEVLFFIAPMFTYGERGSVVHSPITGTGTVLLPLDLDTQMSSVITPDSTYAYIATAPSYGGSPFEIFRFDLRDNSRTTVWSGGRDGVGLYQSPDGRYLFYTCRCQPNGEEGLYRIDTTNDSITLLYSSPYSLTMFEGVAPVGNRIVFKEWRSNQIAYLSLGYAPISLPIELISFSFDDFESWPEHAISSNGEWVLFRQWRKLNDIYRFTLHVAPIDGNTPVSQPFAPLLYNADFSADGQALWLNEDGIDGHTIFYLPLAEAPMRTVFHTPPNVKVTMKHILSGNRVILQYQEENAETASLLLADLQPSASIKMGRTLFEEGQSTILTVALMPASSQAVTLSLEVTGSATVGKDITIEPSTLVIPPNQDLVTISVTFSEDEIPEPIEEATLRLMPQSNVALGTPSEITFTIVDELSNQFLPVLQRIPHE